MRGTAVIAWIAVAWLGVAFSYADSTLYAGQPASEAKITLRNWGSGTIEDSSDTTFVGSRSLKVSTRGLFSGGWIEFANPVDIRADLNAPNGVMRFALRFPGVSAPGGGAVGIGGGMPGFGTPGEMAGGPRMPGGPSVPGAPTGPAGGSSGQTTPPTLRELRIVLETSDGKRTEVMVPLQNLRPDESGWQMLSVPLRSIPDLRETNGQIRKIGMFGDTAGIFYIGEIRTLRESGTLQGYIAVQNMYGTVFTSRSQERLSIASGDELIFYGVAEGVSIPVEYRWSFSGDPSQVDGIGNAIRRRFPKRGVYTVHLTIVDPAGIRPPATAKIEIQVN